MSKELIVYGASDDYVLLEGALSTQIDAVYADVFCKITDSNGEYIRIYASYGSEGVEWKLRVENPFNWDIEIGERPDYDSDPAFYIQTPVGELDVEEFEELWENPSFDLVAT